MSIREIPERYLNDTIFIYRQSEVIDDVGDFDVSQSLAYASLNANLQPQKSDVEFELQGKIHLQSHSAYINRVENDIIRQIKSGDIVISQDTGLNFIVLGIEEWETANRQITDSHHIKLLLKTMTGTFDVTEFKTMTVKGKIV